MASQTSEPAKIPAPSRLMLLAAGIGVLSAMAAFLFLLLREQRVPIVVDIAAQASAGERVRPAAANGSPSTVRTATPNEIDFETFNFSLARARSYRAIGPVRVRLLRTDRSNSYDVAILVKNKRMKRSRMRPGEPIAIAIPGTHPDTRMVVTRIAKNEIWGYLVMPKKGEAGGKR
ncbi:MAG TPA: hypothetical protein VLI55_12255 [Bryobacteraceae bacterium]|nr:hypothetical protein [Bryobacteraceae bacterium]